MTYNVQFSAEAESNIREIIEWITNRSSSGASRWLDALTESTTRLKCSPTSFGLAPESESFRDEIRQVLFGTPRGNTYRALFVLRSNTVHIVSVRASGRALLRPGEVDLPPKQP